VKSFNNGCAANDEFQSANRGLQRGELVRDLLKQRVQVPVLLTDSIARPLLDSRISEALVPGGTLLAEAPGGYGKSHAIVMGLTAAGSEKGSIRWVSLNASDNSPARFLTLLAIALELPEASESSLRNGAGFSDALAMMLVTLSRQSDPACRILVLDNLQNFSNPAVAALLHQLITQLPDNLSVVLISRKALPFETHELELEGRFTRLDREQFEFSRSETFAYFREALESRQLTSVAVDHLYELTGGWVTPLALYRRELAQGTERKPVQETVSVERFLKESVLGNLTQAQRESLRIMAELELCSNELFAELISSVPGGGFAPSQAMEQGLPVKLMPGRGRWYALNPLLQEWLRSPVMPGYSDRMSLASGWFSARGQFPEALKYALMGGNTQEVVRIAAEGSEALLLGQDTASLLRLRKSLPPQLLQNNIRLKIVYGWVHALGGQFHQARILIDDIDESVHQEQLARIQALKAFILRGEGDVDDALAMADKALCGGQLSTQGQLITQIVRSSALCAAGKFGEARDANRAASRLAREAGDSGSEALAVYSHARIEMGKGALRYAEQLLRTGMDTAMQELAQPARIGETRMQLNLALVLWHQGRQAEADRLLVTCGRHAEQTRDIGLLLVMAIRVLMCRAAGRLDDAFVWIGRAERTMQAWQVDETVFVPVLEALKASCWLAQQQTDRAAAAVQKLEPYRASGCVPELFPMMPGLLDCLQVRIDLARGECVRAHKTLQEVRQRYQHTMPLGVELHIRLLEALLAQDEKGFVVARKTLVSVVAEASKEHFISPFAELKSELQELMAKGFDQLPDNAFKAALGQLYEIDPVSDTPGSLAEPISDREQGVLELIARGLSNQEIADKLHISLHTVKTHARRINAKLDVKSRTQATVRARELGLL
jgi:LuxR family maltose regulon positive regulatory protein